MSDPLAVNAKRVIAASGTTGRTGGYLGTVGSTSPWTGEGRAPKAGPLEGMPEQLPSEAAVERTWMYLQRVPKYPPVLPVVHFK